MIVKGGRSVLLHSSSTVTKVHQNQEVINDTFDRASCIAVERHTCLIVVISS